MVELLVSIVAPIVLAILVVIFLFKVCYKTAPPNTAMVVTGPRKSKTIIGKGCFVIPILQRVDKMSLKNIQAILSSGQDKPEEAISAPSDSSVKYGFTRGAEYYGGKK